MIMGVTGNGDVNPTRLQWARRRPTDHVASCGCCLGGTQYLAASGGTKDAL